MDPLHVTIVVLGIALLFFGYSSIAKWLDYRLNKRKEENRSKEVADQLSHVQFLSDNDVEHMKIMVTVMQKQSQIGAIKEEAEDTHLTLVRGMTKTRGGTVQDVQLDGTIAEELVTNARPSEDAIKCR